MTPCNNEEQYLLGVVSSNDLLGRLAAMKFLGRLAAMSFLGRLATMTFWASEHELLSGKASSNDSLD